MYLYGPYGPYIHSGSQNDRAPGRARHHQPKTSYAIWGLFDGNALLHDARTRGPQRCPGPSAFFIPPGTGISIELDQATTWSGLTFDAVHVPRQRGQDGRGPTWKHVRRHRQPTATAIWGVDLPVHIPEDLVHSCLHMLRTCNAIWWCNDPSWARANARLGLWLAEYLAWTSKDDTSIEDTSDSMLHLCQQVIQDQLHLGIGIKELANALGMGRTQLHERIVQATGCTPGTFIRRYRLQRARQLLSTSKDTIANIGTHCGYRSTAAFIRAFERAHGMSPHTWRDTGQGH